MTIVKLKCIVSMTSESMWGGNMTPNTSMAGSDAVDEFLSTVWAKRRR